MTVTMTFELQNYLDVNVDNKLAWTEHVRKSKTNPKRKFRRVQCFLTDEMNCLFYRKD